MNLYPVISPALGYEIDGIDYSDGVDSDNDYKNYLTAASNTGVGFISYDLYLRDNSDSIETTGFYRNMKLAREVAEASGKPFYAFVQVGTDFEDDNNSATSQNKLTTVQEMYLEANAALAMGARGINYYSVIQPMQFAQYSSSAYDEYRSGLINVKGEANNGAGGANYEYYNAAKRINAYIEKVDEVLMNSTYEAVVAASSTNVPNVSGAVTTYGSLSSITGADAMVGCFDYCGKEAYMVVNISCDGGGTGSAQSITLNFDGKKNYSYTGMDCVEHIGVDSNLTFSNLPAGEAVLVVLD